ncbi:MAG: serine/threonine protein kinase [Planctomycetota bacterium]|nr:MAG: serine/threonine protein kinase [Planctomycetota bacterium]
MGPAAQGAGHAVLPRYPDGRGGGGAGAALQAGLGGRRKEAENEPYRKLRRRSSIDAGGVSTRDVFMRANSWRFICSRMVPAAGAGGFAAPRGRRARRILHCVMAWSAAAPLFAGQAASAPSTTRPGASADWPMFRGNSLLTGVATSTLPEKLEVRWRFETGELVQSSAAIVEGVVYVGCDDGKLYALDLKTGSARWKFDTKSAIKSSPTVYEGLVLFGDDDGVLHAVRARDGSEKWSFKTEAEIAASVNCKGDRLVFGSYDGSLYCLALADGKLLWKFSTESRIHGTSAIVDGRVLVAGCDENLHVIRLEDGTPERAVLMGGVSGCSAAMAGDRVYVGTFGNQVLAIDWKKGERVWMYENPDRQFPYMASAALTDRLVVIGGRDKVIHALDRETGREVWSFQTQARVESSAVIVGERVFAGSSDGNLYELDLATGTERWRFETGAGLIASPAVGEGCLVVGADDGVIYCFGEKRGADR